jgi:hypothetical protein
VQTEAWQRGEPNRIYQMRRKFYSVCLKLLQKDRCSYWGCTHSVVVIVTPVTLSLWFFCNGHGVPRYSHKIPIGVPSKGSAYLPQPSFSLFLSTFPSLPPPLRPISSDFERIKFISSTKSRKTYMINKTCDNIVLRIWTTQCLCCIIVPTAETQTPCNQWVRGVKTSSPTKCGLLERR